MFVAKPVYFIERLAPEENLALVRDEDVSPSPHALLAVFHVIALLQKRRRNGNEFGWREAQCFTSSNIKPL